VPALVTPRLEVIADGRAVHTVLFGRNGQLDEFARGKLLRRRLISQPELSHGSVLSREDRHWPAESTCTTTSNRTVPAISKHSNPGAPSKYIRSVARHYVDPGYPLDRLLRAGSFPPPS
jgi:hypothetical protein